MNYTIVMKDGDDGYACFTKGQNSFFVDDPTQALGYADSVLTDYLINQAHQFALPWLLKQMAVAPSDLRSYEMAEPITNNRFQVLEIPSSELSLIVNATNHMPYKIRVLERHATFGNSTNDLLLSNYSTVPFGENSSLGILLPHRLQTVFNSANVLEDVKFDRITINRPLNKVSSILY